MKVFGVLFSIVFHLQLWASPSSFVYSGKIIKPNGLALEEASVTFNLKILAPNGCPLYEEIHPAVDMRGSGGVVSLPVGTGIRSMGANYEYSSDLAATFDNSLGNIAGLSCAPGAYDPSPGDIRRIRPVLAARTR